MKTSTSYTLDDSVCKQDAVIVIFRSIMNEWFNILLAGILCLVAVFLTVEFPWSLQWLDLGTVFGYALTVPIPLFGLIPLTILGVVIHDVFNYRYLLCEDYLMAVRGLWDLNRASMRINYIHIHGIEIDESLIQRILNLGDIRILGAPGVELENSIVLAGVRRPRKIKDMIQARVKDRIQRSGLVAARA